MDSTTALLSLLVAAALTAAAPTLTGKSILSLETSQFLRFSEDGVISADGGRTDNFYVHFVSDRHIRIQSIKAGCKDCFLTYTVNAEGEVVFKGDEPVNDNDVLETVGTEDGTALRAVNVWRQDEEGSGSASGSGAEEPSSEASEKPECYMGFSSPTAAARCFPSTNFTATRFDPDSFL